ncbi:MAG: 2-oxoacid:acceptor oxidoreductase family protein [Deltaproteobacteria bacterium]|nr:2-oxoacid:acceptor oxidoreductase family protein [Deltaproteobacteria bacterium]
MYVNTHSSHFPREEAKGLLDKRKIIYRSISAGAIAQELGAPRSSNLALLGYFSAFDEGPIRYNDIKATIDAISPKKFKDINCKVFETGYKRGKNTKNRNVFD